MNIPIELVIKILVEFDGRFVLRNRKLIFIGKLLKDDQRYLMLSPIIPHPTLHNIELMGSIFPQVYLRFSPRKEYALSLWYTIREGNLYVSTDVILFTRTSDEDLNSMFVGTF